MNANQNPWVPADPVQVATEGGAIFRMVQLFLMGYGAYYLVKNTLGMVKGMFIPKEIVIEKVDPNK